MAKQKPLPGDAPVERVSWDDLPPQDKLVVLYWIKEAIDAGVKKMVLGTTYRQFAAAVSRGLDFSPAQVWNALPDRTTDHFQHSRVFMDEVDEMIDELEAELDDEEDEQGEEDELGPNIHFDGLGVQRNGREDDQ